MHNTISFIEKNKYEIIINNIIFKINNLKKYNSRVNFKNKELKSSLSFTTSFIEKNINELNPLSIAFLITEKFEDGFKTGFQKAFVKHIKSAWYEIGKGKLLQGIQKIKGSGIGLTPSGDDFITGILYALYLLEKTNKKDIGKLRKAIYEVAKSNNYISRNMILHASKGLYFKQFKDLQKAFINNDKDIKQSFKNLIDIGETSGSDMLTGFYLTLKNTKIINI